MVSILKSVFVRTQTKSIDKIVSVLIDEVGFERVGRLNRRAVMHFYEFGYRKRLWWGFNNIQEREQ